MEDSEVEVGEIMLRGDEEHVLDVLKPEMLPTTQASARAFMDDIICTIFLVPSELKKWLDELCL